MAPTTIPTRTLAPGIEITRVGLGLWAVPDSEWGPADDDQTVDAIETALDLGVNFFDTADVYGKGRSEEILGRTMKGRRDRFIVASKIGWVGYDGDRNRSQYDTVDQLIAGVESNLKRLDTDHLDCIQCHVFYDEPNTPVFLEGFAKLKEQGKVRSWGVSTGDLAHVQRFGQGDTLQIDYSILNRDPEREIFPYCESASIGTIIRGPLAMGILTGKLTKDSTFGQGDFRRNWIEDEAQNRQFIQDLETVDRLRKVADDAGISLVELALRFVISHPAVTTVIPGARSRAQAEANTRAGAAGPLPQDVLNAIDEIVPPGGGRKIWPA